MKRIIASAGLIALGTASLQAAYAPGLTSQEASKPWSIAASLRGFYDDNYASRPSSIKDDSGGIEFRPRASYNLPLDQTYIGLSYEYGLKYYFDRLDRDTDQEHIVDAKLDHRFSDRYRLKLENSFIYAQEPELSGTVTAFRSDATHVRNQATLGFTAALTELVGVEVGYQNLFYDYEDEGDGTYSARLDRLEHRFNADGVYRVREATLARLGYAYRIVDYTRGDLLNPAGTIRGTDRDNVSHFFYVGADHTFNPRIKGDIRVGAQYTDFDKFGDNSWTPYLAMSGSYTYLPGSFVQVGAQVVRSATDEAGNGVAGDFISDQEVANVYVSLTHRITPSLSGNLLGQYQYGRFEGTGQFDNAVDNFFLLGASLDYRINAYWSADLSYGLDRLDSDIRARSFTRNRVSGGVTAKY